MPTLYLTEQGTKLVKISKRLGIERDGKLIAEIPIFKIDRVFVFGNVQLTTQSITFLLENGIPTAFLYTDGRLKGVLEPRKSKNIPLRFSQYQKAHDEAFVVEFSKTIVHGKLRSQRRLIHRFQKNNPGYQFDSELEQIKRAISLLPRRQSRKSILGVEGVGTAGYFRAFKKMLKGWGGFDSRQKRPPKDPVNALLSYGYTVLTTEMFFFTYLAGFDPYLGFYHGIRYGRPALALDLIEEFRHVVVDMLVLELIRRRIISLKDFYESEDGFRMKRKVITKFFEYYERRMNKVFKHPRTGENTNMRKIMEKQVYSLASCILTGKSYSPFFPT